MRGGDDHGKEGGGQHLEGRVGVEEYGTCGVQTISIHFRHIDPSPAGLWKAYTDYV